MFETLSERLQNAVSKIKGYGVKCLIKMFIFLHKFIVGILLDRKAYYL